jgi:hypothetical protein
MAVPTIPALGAATLNRKWIREVNTGTVGSPIWVVVGGVSSGTFVPDTPNMVQDTDQAGRGFMSSTKTGATWSDSLTFIRRVGADPTTYDVGQEFLRLASIGKFGPQNTVQMRISEFDPNDSAGVAAPRIEAYVGSASVSWVPQGGDMLAEDLVKADLAGQGALLIVTHPYPATPAVPLITSATPLALPAAGGTLVTISGSGFLGTVPTTGVKFVSTNATSWAVLNDGLIVAVAPAHAAGTGPIVVTNATGASTTGPTVTYS